MFPSVFETSVYTVQGTVRPTDTLINHPTTASRSVTGEFSNLLTAEDCHATTPYLQSHPNTNQAQLQYEQPGQPGPVYQQGPVCQEWVYQQPIYQQPLYQQPLYQQSSYQPPMYQPPIYQPPIYQQPIFQQPIPVQQPVQATGSEVQLAAKRRRKTEAAFRCPIPECPRDFTTKHRLDSHIKGYHKGIKDNICGSCSYATAHPSDLQRHLRLKHS